MSSTQAITGRAYASNTWKSRICIGLAALLVVGGLVTYLTLTFGRVSGEEFAPELFNRRSFVYYEIPVIRLQIWPIKRTDRTGSLEEYLVAEGLLSADEELETSSCRWDLVYANRGLATESAAAGLHGDARILCSYLDANDEEGNNPWLEWSKKHEDLAAVLWPAVANLARQQLYPFVPDLLSLARKETSTDQLRQRMDERLLEKYLVFAESQQALGRHEIAVELFTEALTHAPQSVAALRGRADSLTALGRSERAAADLALMNEVNRRF